MFQFIWRQVLEYKQIQQVILLLGSLFLCHCSFADKNLSFTDVNFYTLAANLDRLDGKEIRISGWLDVWGEYLKDDNTQYSVYLYPNNTRCGVQDFKEKIDIKVDKTIFEHAKNKLNNKYVTISGFYLKNKKEAFLFGSMDKITGIGIKGYHSNYQWKECVHQR